MLNYRVEDSYGFSFPRKEESDKHRIQSLNTLCSPSNPVSPKSRELLLSSCHLTGKMVVKVRLV